MRIKLVLVGIGSTILGIIGLGASWKPLFECALRNQANNSWGIIFPADVCTFPNYSDGTIGVFLIIGIVLIIAGIKKKSNKSKEDLEQKPNHNL